MYLTTYIRSALAVSVATLLLTGCQENLNLANESVQTENEPAPQIGPGSSVALISEFSGQISDIDGGPGIANVKVSVGDSVTTTDEEGRFTLHDLNITEKAVINYEKEGYVRNSTVMKANQFSKGNNKISSNYLEHAIDNFRSQETFDSQNSITIQTGKALIGLPAAVYSDQSGNTHNGTVVAKTKYLTVTSEKSRKLFPGIFEGKNANDDIVPFVSYGMIAVELKDENGNGLRLSEGATATLTFPANASLEEQNIIPLWYYDFDQGLWIEEGYAELQTDGTYQGTVSHLGTWSLNVPVEDAPGIYRGRIVYPDGTSVKEARVSAIGPNWIKTDISTDENGVFEIEVIPGDDFQLEAYNYKFQYKAKHRGTISGIASGNIVEERM